MTWWLWLALSCALFYLGRSSGFRSGRKAGYTTGMAKGLRIADAAYSEPTRADLAARAAVTAITQTSGLSAHTYGDQVVGVWTPERRH